MVKVKVITSGVSDWESYAFYCPGCGYFHSFYTKSPDGRPKWEFNGDDKSPTFSPSLLVNKDNPESRCHLFLRNGMIQFLSDCHHGLAGHTVECPGWDKS